MSDAAIIAIIVAFIAILVAIIDIMTRHNRLVESHEHLRREVIYLTGHVDGLTLRLQVDEKIWDEAGATRRKEENAGDGA